jgi:hypothetical protein
MNWQPIATAPKDGTVVLVGVDIATQWIVRNAFWREVDVNLKDMGWEEDDTGWWAYRTSMTQERLDGIYEPTHWLPMPEPPEGLL